MPLPKSFAGYTTAGEIRKRRSVMMGLEGPPDSGKTEFCLSAPGPGIVLCLDRGLKGALDNPEPPETRNPDFVFKEYETPGATQLNKAEYETYWKTFYEGYKSALGNPDARTVVLDGDSDSWEIQRLAEFGRLSKVPSILYDNVNAARRVMYARAHDSKKIFLATSRVRKVYVTVYKADGVTPEINSSGNEVRRWNGEYERQGFSDRDYLWHVHLAFSKDEARDVRMATIVKCKPNMDLIGYTFKADKLHFAEVIETIYPDVPLKDWGY